MPTRFSTQTPAEAGFHMPPEWAPHARSWIGWPRRAALWHGRIDAARAAYTAVARTIARFEPVTMLADPEDLDAARASCGAAVDVIAMPLDDSWLRDTGPSFLVDTAGAVAGVAWRFNAWGGKWPDYADDAALAGQVLDSIGARCFAAPFVLEGGAVHVDGAGTILTSEQCLLNPNRNPELDRTAIEALLKAWLGGGHVVWLGQGLEEDNDTDGHVDNLACFARPGLVLAASCVNRADPNHPRLADNLDRLRHAQDARGKAFEIIELPLPAPRMGVSGRLPCSYVNSYIVNGGVIVPSFDDPMDLVALDAYARAFPEREIVPVPALDILRGGGGIHCVTQQQPVGPLASRERDR